MKSDLETGGPMKSLIIVFSILLSIPAIAETVMLKCVIETSQTGDVVSETMYLENSYIYAPVFGGDVAAGSGAVQVARIMGDDLAFEKDVEEDKTVVALTKIGQTLSLGQWKYVERITLDGTAGSLRAGYCMSQKVN